jgi:prephenate dehydrogenase
MTSPDEPGAGRRAAVVGVGLIGGSIGLGLRRLGWHVTGTDLDPARVKRAIELGALDAEGDCVDAEVTFVATTVGAVAGAARDRLAAGSGVVTDVGSVKAPIVAEVDDPRFVGGHPMAGSELEGVDGADPALFAGTTWVLTPTLRTDPDAYTAVRNVVRSLGADVVALPPERHDELVALVSHVPHLAAATLMALASEGAEEHAAVLRLAAGGFRDMTRVAAGHPGIWLDICDENRDAIVATLDRYIAALEATRNLVGKGDRSGLLAALERARADRANLPPQVTAPGELVEVRVPVLDRPGVFAEVTTVLGERGVNIEDVQLSHSAEGGRGVLVLLVQSASAEAVRDALGERGYHPAVRALEQ